MNELWQRCLSTLSNYSQVSAVSLVPQHRCATQKYLTVSDGTGNTGCNGDITLLVLLQSVCSLSTLHCDLSRDDVRLNCFFCALQLLQAVCHHSALLSSQLFSCATQCEAWEERFYQTWPKIVSESSEILCTMGTGTQLRTKVEARPRVTFR